MTKSIISTLFLACFLLAAATSFGQNQKMIDNDLIKDYLAKNHINATKTGSGLYYVITQKGTGENAKFRQKVSMYYLGKLLDGKVFDGNMDDNFKPKKQAFGFTLGVGQVIKGWDEGVALLNQGARATFFIPSGLAYGAMQVGPIPANSVLIFDVALVSVDK